MKARICVENQRLVFEMEMERTGGSIPYLSSDTGPIRCKWLSSLRLDENFEEINWTQDQAPGDFTSIIGRRYNPRYTFGALNYPKLVNYKAVEMSCQGLSKPILSIQVYSAIPVLSRSSRNLIDESCRNVNTMYIQSKVALQGVYKIEYQGAGQSFIKNQLGVPNEGFVSLSAF